MQWLAEQPASIALRESLYLWPLIESTHVLTLAVFVGTAAMLDLRLLGVSFAGVPASVFTSRILPWTRASFALMTVSGLLLFYATPVRNYQNLFFRIKVILLVAAGLNVWLFHSRIHQRVAAWDLDTVPPRAARVAAWDLDRVPPRAARIAAVVSLTAWAGVVVAGRMMAYNWFDCDIQPQPGWVNWAAGCVVPPAE
jgi:hypothetical protein